MGVMMGIVRDTWPGRLPVEEGDISAERIDAMFYADGIEAGWHDGCVDDSNPRGWLEGYLGERIYLM